MDHFKLELVPKDQWNCTYPGQWQWDNTLHYNFLRILLLLYIYKTGTFEVTIIFHVSTILKKKKKQKQKRKHFSKTRLCALHNTVHSLPAFCLLAPPWQANQTHDKPTLKHRIWKPTIPTNRHLLPKNRVIEKKP